MSASESTECALALHYAHTFEGATGERATVIHRDVALKNIMVTYDGQVKLLDFGIAKVKNGLSKTRAGVIKGTVGYMSPEQVRGEALDARTDVFSLGVVLWEMICGRRLFAAQTKLDELRLLLEAPIPAASAIEASVPEVLSRVAERALERERSERFASARELGRALRDSALAFEVEERALFMQERFGEEIRGSRHRLEKVSPRPVEARGGVGGVRSPDEAMNPTARERTKVSSATLPKLERKRMEPAARRVLVAGLAVLLGVGGLMAWELSVGGGDGRLPSPAPTDPTRNQAFGERATPLGLSRRNEGEVVLVMVPEAQVSLGPHLLGAGRVVSFSMPVGTHLLTVQGSDGVRRRLSVRVEPGRNEPLRLDLEDLPAQ